MEGCLKVIAVIAVLCAGLFLISILLPFLPVILPILVIIGLIILAIVVFKAILSRIFG